MYQSPHGPTGGQPIPNSLSRYGSAPGSFITSVVESVIGGTDDEFSAVGSETLMSRFYSTDQSTNSTNKASTGSANTSTHSSSSEIYRNSERPGLQRSFGLNQLAGDLAANNNLRSTGGGSTPLIRHSSSPAGLFSHLLVDNGFPPSRGIGAYSSQAGPSAHGIPNGRSATQLSFNSRQDSLSQISEVSESVGDGSSSDDGARNSGQAYVSGSFPMGSWDDNNTIMFSAPPNKRTRNGDMIGAHGGADSQYGIPRTSLEMENLLHLQPDSVPCKVRAKRGFATHPRSIAERERRTRISEKLRKLQELVPNMDKQTSTADMLELAVQHIKGLQTEVQKLNKDLDKCNCASKPAL